MLVLLLRGIVLVLNAVVAVTLAGGWVLMQRLSRLQELFRYVFVLDKLDHFLIGD